MKKISAWILAISFFSLVACSDSTEYDDLKGTGISTTTTGTGGSGGTGGTGGTGGGGGTIGHDGTTVPQGTFREEAYYSDGTLILVLLMQELTTDQITALQAQGATFGTIYSDSELSGTGTFLPVTADLSFDMNTYYQLSMIQFNAGFTPRQFTTVADIQAAALSGEITITDTGRVFWYELQGKRPA
jgi:hypothetical protein